MLKPVENKGYNATQHFFEKAFIDKINTLKDLPNFPDIEIFAQKCLDLHTGFGYWAIVAHTYMEIATDMDMDAFMEWGKNYGKKKGTT